MFAMWISRVGRAKVDWFCLVPEDAVRFTVSLEIFSVLGRIGNAVLRESQIL